MTEDFAAVALHRPSRPENIGGVLRAADVYGVELVVLGAGELPPEPLGHPTDTTQAWRSNFTVPMRGERETTGAAPPHNANAVVSRTQGETRRSPYTGIMHQ